MRDRKMDAKEKAVQRTKRKQCEISWIIVAVFVVILIASIVTNVKLIFFQEQKTLKNVPFVGVIEENDTGEILVRGVGENIECFRESYIIANSDQIKIVDENEKDISFQDLKQGMYVKVRLWDDDFDFQDMDVLTIVTKIKCSETKEGLNESW